MIKLVEVFKDRNLGAGNNFTVREVYVNPTHVVCLYEDPSMILNLREGWLPKDLDQRQTFTKLHLNQGQSVRQMTVIGSVTSLSEKLGLASNKQQLLHD